MLNYTVYVFDEDDNTESLNPIQVRSNTSLKTVILKGVKNHIERYAADPLDFMRSVNSLHRESEDESVFIDYLMSELSLSVVVNDLNNHTYYNMIVNKKITSLEVGLSSYKEAWKNQLNKENGIQNFESYRPSNGDLIVQGNEIMSERLDVWEIES